MKNKSCAEYTPLVPIEICNFVWIQRRAAMLLKKETGHRSNGKKFSSVEEDLISVFSTVTLFLQYIYLSS